jgi:hypothetical protein
MTLLHDCVAKCTNVMCFDLDSRFRGNDENPVVPA